MDLTVNAEQRGLQEALGDLLRKVWSPDRLRAAAEEPALDPTVWSALAEIGVFGIRVPEADGGMGLGWVEAVLLCEELGRALAPGPIVGTLLSGGLVAGAATGEALVTSVDTRDTVLVAEHTEAATHVVVADDAGLFLVPDAQRAGLPLHRPVDPLTPVAALTLPDGLGRRIGSAGDAARWRAEGALLTAAFQVGVGQGAVDLAVRYAGERVQFDRVIGSFQAVKHLLAEAVVAVDVARAAVWVAAAETDDPERDAAAATAAAKTLADHAAVASGRTCVQVHGGMGYTWEVLAHFYLKRAWLLSSCFGTADEHARALAAEFELSAP